MKEKSPKEGIQKYSRKVDLGGRVRDKQVKFNMTTAEKKRLDKQCDELGLTHQQYILNALAGVAIVPDKLLDEYRLLNKNMADTYLFICREYDDLSTLNNDEAVQLLLSQKKELEEVWQLLRQLIREAEAVPYSH